MTIPTIVYGPMGCGKTRSKEKLMSFLGCKRVDDGWEGCARLPAGNVLVLTYLERAEIDRVLTRLGQRAHVRSFESIRAEAGS